MACVAARISAIISAFSSSVRVSGGAPSAFVDVGWICSYDAAEVLMPRLGGGHSRLKEREESLSTPPDRIQSCQGLSLDMVGEMGWKGWKSRTRISWMINMEGKGACRSLMSMAIALPWNC